MAHGALIKYIGSKRLLVDRIAAIVQALGATSALDVFSGTSRVGHALKARGIRVTSNDHLAYAHALAKCYVQADATNVAKWLPEMQNAPSEDGYFTRTFARQSRFFQPKNAQRIDGMRRWLREAELREDERDVLLVSLMEAADRVDSTTGVQMAYLKSWAPRASNDLELRHPKTLPGKGRATRLDALEAIQQISADVAYLDPPYNQHSYMGNYHVWETLARDDEPEVYGVACKRVDCKDYGSAYNSKRKIHQALRDLVENATAKHLLVSFNDEGHVTRQDMETILGKRGHVRVAAIPYKRYVGAQIGIYNPSGEKVGKVSHLANHELLYLVGSDAEVVERALGALVVS